MINCSTITKLYYSDFMTSCNSRPNTSDYKSAEHKLSNMNELLHNCLEPETESIMQQYLEAQNAINTIDASEAFANGFSLAMKLLIESLFIKKE